MAALVHAVSKELTSTTPLPDTAAERLVAAFVAGDPSLEVELQCAVAEKTSGWSARQLTAVQDLLQDHTSKMEDARVPDAAESVKIQAGQLMAEEFALLAKKVEHDLHLVKVWGQKIRDRESQFYYQRLHRKEARRSKAAGAAADLFSPTHRHAHFHEVPTRDESKICPFLEEALGNLARQGGDLGSNQAAPPSLQASSVVLSIAFFPVAALAVGCPPWRFVLSVRWLVVRAVCVGPVAAVAPLHAARWPPCSY